MKSARFVSLGGCLLAALALESIPSKGAVPFDAAPFGIPLTNDVGMMWEDPREIHQVTVRFKETPPLVSDLRIQYWGSWWPGRHLPKDREPGGGDVGWMELGNWWKYGWRTADAEAQGDGKSVVFRFRPVNAKEFPKEKDYPADFRYTLKLRVASDRSLPAVEGIEAFTDSSLMPGAARLVFSRPVSARGPFHRTPPPKSEVSDSSRSAPPLNSTGDLGKVHVEVFNGGLEEVVKTGERSLRLRLQVVANSDPNTFDRTLVTLRLEDKTFTFKFDDLAQGPLFLPHLGVAVLPDGDARDYAAIAAEQKSRGVQTLHDRVAALPEHTWQAAWEGMPPKKSHIYYPLGLDGGRQRFRLNADGSIDWRSNDHYLTARPGKDTPRLKLEESGVRLSFGLPSKPVHRSLQEEALPICVTTWDTDGVQVKQVAFVTHLEGTLAEGGVPPADAFAVWLARCSFTNTTAQATTLRLPCRYHAGNKRLSLIVPAGAGVDQVALEAPSGLRGLIQPGAQGGAPRCDGTNLDWIVKLEPGQAGSLVVKIPYLILTEPGEREALKKLDFEVERKAVAGYWRRRLDQSASLITPEPMLNEFYRSHAMHLLVNCEREPASERRFARVGSFGYGAYGNESCMMVSDLERRGYHREAQECLDAWLRYQGTVELPGSFASKDGVLYGAGGYEAGGYNQHHGWILWMLAEHYRFTRDQAWLTRAAPGILKGADWIIRETARTARRHELERGLLPAGSLEDIGDWWTWLSTSCYSWRGLDSAAWALEQIGHPEARRVRKEADAFHAALLSNFGKASQLAPVVRLRDGTAVPKVPSYVHRRGRSFGWICETLEGSLHLLITRAIDPKSELGTWIVKDYEDNLYLSNQYGYMIEDFEKYWFSRGGMSMQACLLFGVEPYLYRDDVKHALRALFNGQSVSYFADVRMNTEHALPDMGDWRGDHFKSSDEANAAGWLRQLFVREEDERTLLVGQAIPRDWLEAGKFCGMEKAATWFGPVSVLYSGGKDTISCQLKGPQRNPPDKIRLRFRDPQGRMLSKVMVNGKRWNKLAGDWVILPGNAGTVTVVANYGN